MPLLFKSLLELANLLRTTTAACVAVSSMRH